MLGGGFFWLVMVVWDLDGWKSGKEWELEVQYYPQPLEVWNLLCAGYSYLSVSSPTISSFMIAILTIDPQLIIY